MILLETGVLIHHLRRRERGAPPHAFTHELRRLAELRAVLGIPGMALQEVLAGARTDESVQRLENVLRPLARVVLATEEDHAMAGRLASFCRRKGVSIGAPDALMAAQSILRGAALFAEDRDYEHIRGVLPLLRLHRPGDAPRAVVAEH